MKLNRRRLLQVSGVAGLSAVVASGLNRPAKAQKTRLLVQADPYAARVDAGLNYFKEQAEKQLPLVEKLATAIASGDLEAAKNAYIESRPPFQCGI